MGVRERGMHVHEPFTIIGVSPFHEKIVSYELGVSLKLFCILLYFLWNESLKPSLIILHYSLFIIHSFILSKVLLLLLYIWSYISNIMLQQAILQMATHQRFIYVPFSQPAISHAWYDRDMCFYISYP